MNNMVWLRSHVERCLQDVLGITPEVDGDGDYLIHRERSVGYVSIDVHVPMLVSVSAWAVMDVPFSSKLARELNSINSAMRAGQIYWAHGRVCVMHAVAAESLTRESLDHAYRQVFEVADEVGTSIAAVFGGQVPIGMDESADDETAA